MFAILLVSAPFVAGAADVNPYEGDAGAIRVGAALFRGACAACHGPDGRGISAPDLTALWTTGATDERVFGTIRAGVSGTAMPPNAAADQQIWAIVAYVKSLGTVPPWPRGSGDPDRGRELFAAECARCHRLHGGGGRRGPDLSSITAVRSRSAVVSAIREPGVSVAAGYRAVTLVTPAGERIYGITKGEDAFSIQVIDANERLRGFRKAELRAVEHERASPMPEYSSAELSDAALEDLLEYLRRDAPAAAPAGD
jgi:putative heme-binding domain-containing protein